MTWVLRTYLRKKVTHNQGYYKHHLLSCPVNGNTTPYSSNHTPKHIVFSYNTKLAIYHTSTRYAFIVPPCFHLESGVTYTLVQPYLYVRRGSGAGRTRGGVDIEPGGLTLLLGVCFKPKQKRRVLPVAVSLSRDGGSGRFPSRVRRCVTLLIQRTRSEPPRRLQMSW